MSERYGECTNCGGRGRKVLRIVAEKLIEGPVVRMPGEELRFEQEVEFKGKRIWRECFFCGGSGFSGEAKQV